MTDTFVQYMIRIVSITYCYDKEMDLRQLKYLAALGEHKSFTAAAAALHVAQPAVSTTIARLERQAGVELFDRTARSLTEAGRSLAARGTRAIAELDAASAELAEFKGLEAGSIRIGAIHWLAPFDLAAALGRFHARHPEITIALVENDAPAMLDQLLVGELDLVIHNVSSDTVRPKTGRAVLVSEPIMLAIPRDHEWQRRKRVSLAEIATQRMVAFRSGSAYRRHLDDAFSQRGLNPVVSLESSDMLAVRNLVAQRLGVALLPQSLIGGGDDVVAIPTDPLTREVVLVWRVDHIPSPAASALRKLLVRLPPAPLRDG